jgi:hypothetical protein
MFDDNADFSRFRAKPRDAGRRTTISSQVSHADIDLETAAGPFRLYVTSTILVEIDVDACLPGDLYSEPAPHPIPRLPKGKRC